MTTDRPPELRDQLRDLAGRGVSILIGSRDGGRRPLLARACGCIALGEREVALLVPKQRAQHLLDAIAASGAVAAVLSEPSTHRTIQLKGEDAEVLDAGAEATAVHERYVEAFAAELERVGHSRSVAHALAAADTDRLAVVRFTPTAFFDQTPGPHAGEPFAGVSR